MIAPAQCKAARQFFGLTQVGLGQAIGKSLPTIQAFEAGSPWTSRQTIEAIEGYFISRGASLTDWQLTLPRVATAA